MAPGRFLGVRRMTKEILILQKNIPKALGAKESIVETLIDEVKAVPFIVKDFKSAIKKIANEELKIELSNDQLEWIKKGLKEEVKSYTLSFALMFGALFALVYDKDLKDLAIGVFILGVARILYK